MLVIHKDKDVGTEIKDIYYDSIYSDETKTELTWVIYINGVNYGEFYSEWEVKEEYYNIIKALRNGNKVYQIREKDI